MYPLRLARSAKTNRAIVIKQRNITTIITHILLVFDVSTSSVVRVAMVVFSIVLFKSFILSCLYSRLKSFFRAVETFEQNSGGNRQGFIVEISLVRSTV